MVEFELAMAKTEYDKAIKSLVDLSKISAGYQARAEKAEAALARVSVLADQYAATAATHADVRDTMPHTEANIRPHVQAKALAGMAQHHADQLRDALKGTS